MLKPGEDYPLTEAGKLDYGLWSSDLCKRHTHLKPEPILVACAFVSKIPKNGEKLLRVGLEFADLLGDLHQETESIIVALVYRVQRGRHAKLSQIEAEFGVVVAHLIREVNRMSTVSVLNLSNAPLLMSEERDQSENVRKMLVSLIDDVRVAIVKLAERIIALRLAKNAARSRRLRTAQETLSFFAPLANRLGIWRLKWELEDLSFRYLQKDQYNRVAKQLSLKRGEREIQIARHVSNLENLIAKAKITAKVEGRAKHIYSIWKKMRRKGIGFSEIYDVLAVRIQVKKTPDCYAMLGVVHTQFAHIPEEFDDYIANPKKNGYQSIHTAVYDKLGNVLEVQIKTEDMHSESELGICAHWAYKDEKRFQDGDSLYADKLVWLRQVLAWQEELGGFALGAELASGLEEQRVYVYTPDGHVLDLVQGATPIDFAYRIHTDVGNTCIGARVDGQIAALNQPLQTGQRVEIIAGDKPGPSREWLDVSRAFVRTNRARAKIQSWFRARDFRDNVLAGEKLLKEELFDLGLKAESELVLENISHKMGYKNVEVLYHALSVGDCEVVNILEYSDMSISQVNQMDLIEASEDEKELTPAVIQVLGRNRTGLLHDFTQVFISKNITMIELNATTDVQSDTASIRATAIITDLVTLAQVIERIKSIPDVIEVERQ